LAAAADQYSVLACNLLCAEKMAHLVLASSSPRRRELLAQLGLQFDIFSPDIDESMIASESASAYVERLARAKAEAVQLRYPESIIVAADTSLSVDGLILGKPESKQHAFDMWQQISGRKHDVFSGVCVRTKSQIYSIVVRTQVEFQTLSVQDMESYWATGEPIGKAGAYAIQGIAARYIPRIEGSYSNVVGLPLHETVELLQTVKALN
jgi:septum formation protein